MLKYIKPKKHESELAIICEIRAYVFTDESIPAVAKDLTDEKIAAAAVLNLNHEVQGIIVSRHLFTLLGKPYGRALLFRHKIGEVSEPVRSFSTEMQVGEMEEHINDDINSEHIHYYCSVDSDRKYVGIFSSKTALLYIARQQKQDADTAHTIQNRIVPPYSYFKGKKCEIVCAAKMAQSVGGDYYFVKQFGQGNWFFAFCDISGKGISAAIITAVLAGFFETADFSFPLEKIISQLNSLIVNTFSLEKYLTGIFALYNENKRICAFADMGHGMLYHYSEQKDSQKQQLMTVGTDTTAANMPVGVIDDVKIKLKSVQLEPGEVLILVTDGISEQNNKDGIVFDLNQLAVSLNENNDKGKYNLKKTKIEIYEKLFDFKGPVMQKDDMSLLLLAQY
jgi:sigma-B regulation protein RsbU (phosphoserine phosphatase)